jgi:hypothetical protein
MMMFNCENISYSQDITTEILLFPQYLEPH